MANQAIDRLDNLVREELPQIIHEMGPVIAPVFDKIKRTAFGVKSQEGLGRGYKVIHLYETGVAGIIESGDPMGPAMNAIETNQVQILAQGSAADGLSIFPDAKQSPHTGDIKRELQLHKMVGNFSIPAAWKQADLLNAAQIKKVARDMKAVAKLKAIYEASSFFSHSAQNSAGSDSTAAGSYVTQVLGRVSTIAVNTDLGSSGVNDYIDIVIDEAYGRISNFRQGMRIDVVRSVSNVLQNHGSTTYETPATTGMEVRNYASNETSYVHLIIMSVDYLGKKITLRPINAVDGANVIYTTGFADGTGAETPDDWTDDWLVFAHTSRYLSGSRPQFSWGINDWVKSSGTILGGASGAAALDLAVYPQFKSQVVAVNGPLTDDVINGYIGGYLDAYPGETLDTVITTQGVQLKWLQQPGLYNNRQNYERTGKALSFKGGWSQISYEFGGRTYEWIMSPMCLSNTLYALKFGGDNIKRYSPPRLGGMEASMGQELEFLAPLGGHSGVFKIAHSSGGQPQDLLECPFWYYTLIAPIDPRGVKMSGLTEATMLV